MNVRISIVLIILLALVGSWVFLFELRKPEEAKVTPIWFYDVEGSEIQHIVATHDGETRTYAQSPDRLWHFDTPDGTPVSMDKFSGVTLLLSGPRSQQSVSGVDITPAKYGFDPPATVVTIGMTGGRSLTMELGDLTPDGDGQYVRLKGSLKIFTVTSSWGLVLSGLVTDPPYPPIPTSTPTGPES